MLIAGRYRLDDVLGRGGMGEVWRAVDEVLGRPVAVKVLLNRTVDEAGVARFRLEARTAARLNHPHVVAVYDFGTDQDRLYLVMELLSGRSLADQLAEHGRLSPERVAEVGAQVAAGLAAAHREGVVHRDIKPANLLVASDTAVKIADFGIARFLNETAPGLTADGQVIGTSSYLAPERVLKRPSGPAADVYALGCVLYHLLTGRPPFQADTAAAVVYQHVDVVPDPARLHRPEVPEALDDFVLRLLAKDPDRRPTAAQAADTLASFAAPGERAARAWSPAAGLGAVHRSDAPAPTDELRAGRSPGGRWPRRRSRMVTGTIAAGAVVTAAVVTLTAMNSGTDDLGSAAKRPSSTPSSGSPTPTPTTGTASRPSPSATPSRTTIPVAPGNTSVSAEKGGEGPTTGSTSAPAKGAGKPPVTESASAPQRKGGEGPATESASVPARGTEKAPATESTSLPAEKTGKGSETKTPAKNGTKTRPTNETSTENTKRTEPAD